MNMNKWEGKVAVVTGASTGIGADIAVELANAGILVVGLARRAEVTQALSNRVTGNGKIYARKCDLRIESDIIDAFDWIKSSFGGIDILINNAGLLKASFITESDTSDYKSVIDLNLLAACICIRETVKDIRERNAFGHIVVINSILGHRIPDAPIPLFHIYPATKHALVAITKTLRQEMHYQKANIKVTNISPGMVKTDFLGVYNETKLAALPKLKTDDVTSAVLYALSTPNYVQVEEIILQAMFRYDADGTEVVEH